MIRSISVTKWVASALILAVAVKPALSAEVVDCEMDADSAYCEEPAIDEIIVTALRRETSLHATPMAVSVLSSKRLGDSGASDFVDYVREVPGLSFTDLGLGGEKAAIRGVQSDPCCEVPATAIYFDDIPVTFDSSEGVPYSPDPILFDLDRVEVLRGPQGVHFGAGALGGAMRIMPQRPKTEQSESLVVAGVQTTRGGAMGFTAGGVLNRPVLDSMAAVRAAAYFRDDDGFVDNLALNERRVNDDRTRMLRLGAIFKPTSRTELLGQVAWQKRESGGNNMDDLSTSHFTQFRQVPEPNEDEWSLAYLSLSVDFARVSLHSTTAYYDRDFATSFDNTGVVEFVLDLIDPDNNFPTHTLPSSGDTDNSQKQWSQELRFVSDSGAKWQWLAGIYLSASDYRFQQSTPTPNLDAVTGGLASLFGAPDDMLRRDYATDYRHRAVFGDLTYAVGDRTEVSAGARWFSIDLDTQFQSGGLNEFAVYPVASEGSSSDTDVTPRLSVNHRVNDELSMYASVAKGFRFGGLNQPSQFTPECVDLILASESDMLPLNYESDDLISYEAGLRSRWRQALVRAAIYHIDWDDIQSLRFIGEAGCVVGFVENAGQAVINGLELELEGQIGEGLEYRLAASVNDAALDADSSNFGASKGTELAGVPRYSGLLRLGHAIAGPFGTDGHVESELLYVSSSYTSFADTRRKLDAYNIVNLRARFDRNNWGSLLYVNNVLDERGVVISYDFFPLGEWDIPTRPRTIGASVTFRF